MSSILASEEEAAAAEETQTEETQPEVKTETPAETKPVEKAKWIDQLLPKHKDNADLVKKLSEKYPKIDDMVSAVEELDKLRTEQSEKDAGKVKAVEEYELPVVEYPKGMEADASVETWYREKALELGLSKEVAGKLWEDYNKLTVERLNEAIEADKKARDDAVVALKKEWGNDFKANIEVTRRFVKKHFGEDVLKDLDDTGMGNRTSFIKKMHEMAKGFGEDTIVAGETPAKDDDDWMNRMFPGLKIAKRAEE